MALINTQTSGHEGGLTGRIEEQTAKIPSVGFLELAIGSMVASATLAFVFNRKDVANFVGLWAPSILVMGLYNKVVKLQSDSSSGSYSAAVNRSHRVAS